MSEPAGADRVLSLDGVRILLVDDHAAVRDVVTQLLEHFGAMVTPVAGVPEALETLERERPHVMISDIEMPGEDGYALIRKVRAMPSERGGLIPGVALTSLHSAEDRARLLRAGFQYHVPKPVDGRRLAAVVAILAAKE
jgi:CheY-like chemotaxis protein